MPRLQAGGGLAQVDRLLAVALRELAVVALYTQGAGLQAGCTGLQAGHTQGGRLVTQGCRLVTRGCKLVAQGSRLDMYGCKQEGDMVASGVRGVAGEVRGGKPSGCVAGYLQLSVLLGQCVECSVEISNLHTGWGKVAGWQGGRVAGLRCVRVHACSPALATRGGSYCGVRAAVACVACAVCAACATCVACAACASWRTSFMSSASRSCEPPSDCCSASARAFSPRASASARRAASANSSCRSAKRLSSTWRDEGVCEGVRGRV